MRFFAAAPLLCMFLGIGLSTIGIIPPLVGFGLYALSGLLGIAAAVLIYFTRVRKGRLNFRILVVVAAAPFFVVLVSAAPGLSYPPINDITTDLENPPPFAKALETNPDRDMEYPEPFKSVVLEKYADLEPLLLEESPERVYQRAVELAKAQSGWTVTNEDVAALTVEGEAQSYFFGFIDDFVIRVKKTEEGARVDMRSKSRDGKGDLGANAKRIRNFLAELAEPAAE